MENLRVGARRNKTTIKRKMYQQVPDDETSSDVSKGREMKDIEMTDAGSIKFTICQVGASKHTASALPSWTIKQFKERIYYDEIQQNKNVRLIYCGKLLRDEQTLNEAGVRDGAIIHCAISEFHSEIVNNPEDENHNDPGALNREEDVQIPPWLLTGNMPRQGSNGDFVLGFIMGFFIGVLTLIWVWQRSVPRRQKFGIILGILCNMLVSVMQAPVHQSNGGSTPNDGAIDPGVGN